MIEEASMPCKVSVIRGGEELYIVRTKKVFNGLYSWHQYKDNKYALTEDIAEATEFTDRTEVTVATKRVYAKKYAMHPVV